MINIAINGFGRIGRSIVRALYESGKNDIFKIVAINDLAPASGMAHLLKYDTTHGRFSFCVEQENEKLVISKCHVSQNDKCKNEIALLHFDKIEHIPWHEHHVDIVLDCTGIFGSKVDGLAQLKKYCFHILAPKTLMPLLFMASIIKILAVMIVLSLMDHALPIVLYL